MAADREAEVLVAKGVWGGVGQGHWGPSLAAPDHWLQGGLQADFHVQGIGAIKSPLSSLLIPKIIPNFRRQLRSLKPIRWDSLTYFPHSCLIKALWLVPLWLNVCLDKLSNSTFLLGQVFTLLIQLPF